MKIAFRQDVLVDLLTRGSLASLLEVPNEDDGSGVALLRRMIKIVVNDKAVEITSYSDRLAAKYSINISKENAIILKETGSIAVLAKDLIDWVKAQDKNSTIGFNLHIFDSPQPIRDNDSEKMTVFRIGSVKVVSKDGHKTVSQREFDCYDPEQVKSGLNNQTTQKCFEIDVIELKNAFQKGCCAATKVDYQNKYNNVYIQLQNDHLYFFTVDVDKCARYKLAISGAIEYKEPLVVPYVLLDHVLKAIGENEKVEFRYGENKLFIHQGAFIAKLNIIPNVNLSMKIFGRAFEELATVSKAVLTQMFNSSSLVNKDCVMLNFNKKDINLTIKAISETGRHKPSTANTTIDSVNKDLRIILGVTSVQTCLKVMKSEVIRLYYSCESNKPNIIKITSDTESNFEYSIPCLQNALYDEKHES